MKKIGILTLNGNNNYGNKLQNYALKRFLEKKGFVVDTIWFKKSKMNCFIVKIKYLFPIKPLYRRMKIFEKFTRVYLSRKYYSDDKKLQFLYDFFIVGSDQVWNYTFPTFSDKYFLNFSKDVNKNISYAASFGVDNIEDDVKDVFINGLKNFSNISVREKSGKAIVDSMIKSDKARVCVDPTLLLDYDDWNGLAKKPSKLKTKKYILNYFLGKTSEKTMEEISRIANENGCDIINVLDKNSDFYISGPQEFLYLEKNAFMICTDSFHSCVFAFIFNRPFIVFDRNDDNKKMTSRIETFVKTFNLEDRKYDKDKNFDKYMQWDYSNSYKILVGERNKANMFLDSALLNVKKNDRSS